jgi:ribosome-associated protein
MATSIDTVLAPHERAIEERFVRSSGPGGQNVNKVSTAVELRFDVGASSLTAAVKSRLAALAGNRLTAEGVLVLDSREHRTQTLNREAARARLAALIEHAAVRPKTRKPTKPTKGAKERRLTAKKRRSDVKKLRTMFVLAALAVVATPVLAAERAASPADAAVLVRLVGSVHVEITELGAKRSFDLDRVEIGTGSGFVISPDGHVLTNDHVVSNSEVTIDDGLRKVALSLKVSRIEVCVPPDSSAARNGGPACVEALVAASNSELDLAVLFVTGTNQPYLPLGDSDVLTPGQPVQALGFPFGRTLNVGRNSLSSVVPEITTSSGTVSSFRASDSGTRRFVQIDGNVNPGNSGGPLVNKDGFAVGVIHSRLKDATGIAFAIPINQVKDFLESRGLDQLMPTQRMRLGGIHRFDNKGVSMRLPDGLTDMSPRVVQVDTEPAAGAVALRIDRVFSPWAPERLERELVQTRTFDPLSSTGNETRVARILDLGREALVARFIGGRDQVAFNESVLRAALASVEAEPLIREPDSIASLEWSMAAAGDAQRPLPVPAGWLVESGAPTACARLSMPEAAGSAVSPRDFTVALRVAVWPGTVDTNDVSAACWPSRGTLGAASYLSRSERLGAAYSAEGVMVRIGQRVIQVEVIAPAQRAAYARELLAVWVKKATD